MWPFRRRSVDELKNRKDVAGLISILNSDRDEWSRVEAARALGDLRELGATPPLLEKALTGWPNERSEAFKSLRKIQGKNLTSLLIEIATNDLEDLSRRHAAVDMLGGLGDQRATPVLRRLLSFQLQQAQARPYNIDVYSAAAALEIFCPNRSEIYQRLQSRFRWRSFVRRALRSLDDLSFWSSVIAPDPFDISEKDWELVQGVVCGYREALQELLDSNDPNQLLEFLRQEEGEDHRTEEVSSFRSAVVSALGQIGAAGVMPVLISALDDGDDQVRHSAAEALVLVGDRKAVDSLKAAIQEGRIDPEELSDAAIEFIGWRVSYRHRTIGSSRHILSTEGEWPKRDMEREAWRGLRDVIEDMGNDQ